MPSRQVIIYNAMETDNNIEAPQDNIDKENSTFKEIVFKDIEPCRPTSWEDYSAIAEKNPSFYEDAETDPLLLDYDKIVNKFSSEERIKQFVALGKLLQLRDYWVKDYDEFDSSLYNIVTATDGSITVLLAYFHQYSTSLSFPTRAMAEDFVDYFGYLIKEACPLV